MKPNKIMELAEKQKAKSWTNFQLLGMRPSVDPNAPPLYLVDVQGQRGDGVVFTITVAIDKGKYDLVPPSKTVEIVRALLNDGIRRLMTFTGCECTAKAECDQHKRPTLTSVN